MRIRLGLGARFHDLVHRAKSRQTASDTPDPLFDRAQQAVSRGEGWIPIPPIAGRILTYLVDHQGTMVSEAALIREGWQGEPRAPADLYKQIHRLREALEVDTHHPRHLLTRRGAGYLLRDVTESPPESAVDRT